MSNPIEKTSRSCVGGGLVKHPTTSTTTPPPPSSLPTMIRPFDSCEHKVTHNYTDHMNDPDGDYEVQQIVQRTGGPGAEQSFPMKLHYMLNDIEQDKLSHIVSWMPHGRCFVVHNQRLFVEKILGCWFRQSKIASFQRQLNIYGFQRLTAGPDKNGYYHELFLRGKPGLAARIQRQKLKGTKTRRAASPESEPNFYAMTPMPASTKTRPSKAAVPLTSMTSLPSPLDKSAGSTTNPNALTLQKIVPTLFSPASFETTVHLVPQQQSRQHGLMVTSTCSLTLKPTDDLTGGGTSTFSVTQFPLTTTLTFQGNNPVITPTTTARANETFWTALGAGRAIPTTTALPTLTLPIRTPGEASAVGDSCSNSINKAPAPVPPPSSISSWLARH